MPGSAPEARDKVSLGVTEPSGSSRRAQLTDEESEARGGVGLVLGPAGRTGAQPGSPPVLFVHSPVSQPGR